MTSFGAEGFYGFGSDILEGWCGVLSEGKAVAGAMEHIQKVPRVSSCPESKENVAHAWEQVLEDQSRRAKARRQLGTQQPLVGVKEGISITLYGVMKEFLYRYIHSDNLL